MTERTITASDAPLLIEVEKRKSAYRKRKTETPDDYFAKKEAEHMVREAKARLEKRQAQFKKNLKANAARAEREQKLAAKMAKGACK